MGAPKDAAEFSSVQAARRHAVAHLDAAVRHEVELALGCRDHRTHVHQDG